MSVEDAYLWKAYTVNSRKCRVSYYYDSRLMSRLTPKPHASNLHGFCLVI